MSKTPKLSPEEVRPEAKKLQQQEWDSKNVRDAAEKQLYEIRDSISKLQDRCPHENTKTDQVTNGPGFSNEISCKDCLKAGVQPGPNHEK